MVIQEHFIRLMFAIINVKLYVENTDQVSFPK